MIKRLVIIASVAIVIGTLAALFVVETPLGRSIWYLITGRYNL